MRIAILADPLDNQSAGVHVYTRELIRALLARNSAHEYFLIRQKNDPTLKNCTQIILPSINLPIGYMSIRLFTVIPWVIVKHKIDVVLEPAHFGPFNLPSRIKRVTMIHDLTPILFPEFHRWHSQILQRIFLKGILRRSNLILSNSENTSRDIHRVYHIPEQKIKTILLGRDEFYQPAPETTFLEKYNLQSPFFHFVGTVEPRKDLMTLLNAFAIFRSRHHGTIKLYIAGGKGWKSAAFAETLEAHPFKKDIQVLGFVEKELLRELHTHSKALIYPSIYEGFGFPVLEALSCGGQVICSNNSSLPEVGGDLAHYFETSNAEDLADKMIELAEINKDASFQEKAVSWSRQFSWREHAAIFEKRIEGL